MLRFARPSSARHRPSGDGSSTPGDLVIELRGLRRTLLDAARLFTEAAIVPSLLFAFLLGSAGLGWAVGAALGWLYLVLAVRWARAGALPGTLILCAGMFHGRAAVALAASSAVVYLLQPIAGSLVMALLFCGSALAGRPVTIKLARDFVHVPAHVLARANVRRMFTQVAVLWGLSRLIDAGLTTVMFSVSLDAGLLSRGLVSPALTVLTIGVCAAWGVRALRRDGVSLRTRPLPTPAPAFA